MFNKILPELSDDAIKKAVDDIMEAFDSDNDNKINESEFAEACVKLAEKNDFISRELSEKASYLIHANFKTTDTNGSFICKMLLL